MSQATSTFERDGVVIVDRVLTPAQLAAAREGVEWAMASAGGQYRWIKQRTYEWHAEYPVFIEIIEHPLVLDIARQVLGDDFHLIAAQCSRNTRDDHYAPGVMNFHQDGVFFPQPDRVPVGSATPAHRYGFSAMWAVRDTPLAMGPTEFILRSHLDGDRKYTNDDFPRERLLRRDVPAGSLLLFNHRTWHRGAPNTTPTPRDLITNAYARPEVGKVQILTKQADGSEKYAAPDALLVSASAMRRQLLRPR